MMVKMAASDKDGVDVEDFIKLMKELGLIANKEEQ